MMLPAKRNRDLWDLMADPFDMFMDAAPAMPRPMPSTLMKTDVKQTDTGYELDIDLPGFKKENVTVQIKDGYLEVDAKTESETEDTGENGSYLRKERFSGQCSRSFYVGDDINEEEIKAKFADGVLKIAVPKKVEQPQIEEKKTIAIED